MATVTGNELRELTDLINNRFHELDKKIDDRFNDLKDDIKVIDKKLDIYIAKTDERLNSIDQGLADIKRQSEKQDNRLWVLISGMCLALLCILAKFALNP
jgi:flagellar capping protein FliD